MSKIKTLEKNCERRYTAARQVRERLAQKAATGKRKTEKFFRSPTALIGAFSAGVVVDQVRQQRDAEDSGDSGQQSRQDSQPAKDGVAWAALFIRMAFPYVVQGFTTSSSTADIPPD